MTNQDYGIMISQLAQRVDELEKELQSLNSLKSISDQDWDNATLLQEWNICERTAANYRKQGLTYYKRGGRIYYTSEDRAAFLINHPENKNKY